MASMGKVVGGHFVNATISTNRKGELALSSPGFKKTPNLTADAVRAWEEMTMETRGGAAGAISKVGQAASLAALPGPAGKAASAAVGSVADLVGGGSRSVRVDWIDGKQSLIQLPDKLFQHLAILLADRRIATATSPTPEAAPAASGVLGQLTKLAGTVRPQADDADRISKLAALRDQGALTEEEFAAMKAQILGQPAPAIDPALATAPPPAPPVTPLPEPMQPAAPSSPPVWAPDPQGRHEYRYWDGTAWTEHVSTQGVQATDPA